jgi:hypothetical protein
LPDLEDGKQKVAQTPKVFTKTKNNDGRKKLSKLLAATAFVISLVRKDFLGAIVALPVSVFGVFLFLETLKMPILRTETGLEDKHYHSINGACFFLIGGSLTQLLIPFLIEKNQDFQLSVAFAVAYVSFLLVTYKVVDSTVLKKHTLIAKGANLEAKTKQDRAVNSACLLCLFLSIDGANLMYLLNLVLSFSHEIGSLAKSLKLSIMKMAHSVQEKEVSRTHAKIFKDFDDRLWKRSFYGKTHTAVPLLAFSFFGALPFAIISYRIDLFNVNFVLLLTMIALSMPGLVSVLAVDPPWRIGRGRGRQVRNRLIMLSLLPPIVFTLTTLVFSFPRIVLPLPAWVFTLLTCLVGLPLLQGLTCMEKCDYNGSIKWMKKASLGLFCLILLACTYAQVIWSGFRGVLQPSFIILSCLALFLSSALFRVFMQTLYTQFIEGYKEAENREVDKWINLILVPGLNIETFASTIGLGSLLGIIYLVVIALLGWAGVIVNALISISFGIAAGEMLQRKTDKGIHGAFSIALFEILGSTVSLVAIFLSVRVSAGSEEIAQTLQTLGLLIFQSGFWAIPIGTVLASRIARKQIISRISRYRDSKR